MREAILNSLNRRPNTTEGLMYQLKATRLKRRQLLNDTLVALMDDKLIFYVRVDHPLLLCCLTFGIIFS